MTCALTGGEHAAAGFTQPSPDHLARLDSLANIVPFYKFQSTMGEMIPKAKANFMRFSGGSGGVLTQSFHFFKPGDEAVPTRNALGRQTLR